MKKLLCICLLLSVNLIFSQQSEKEEDKKKKNKVVKTVDKVGSSVNEVNQTVKHTNEALKSSVQSSKETFTEIKGLFKSKNKKAKKDILITIKNIDYGNPNLSALQKAISKAKGVKNATNLFENGIATIMVEYTKGAADNLWQKIPDKIRSQFKVTSIDSNKIFISLNE